MLRLDKRASRGRAADEVAGAKKAKGLCPWRDEEVVNRMRHAASDACTLDAAFGKSFWHPGVGLEPGKKWVWW